MLMFRARRQAWRTTSFNAVEGRILSTTPMAGYRHANSYDRDTTGESMSVGRPQG